MSDLPQDLSDQALLQLFIGEESGEEREEAFLAIVERYGPLVLSVCRRGAPCASDADDAFQATFLVLARSAKKVRKQKSLGSWLYGVATRVSARLRREKARQNTVQLFDAMASDSVIQNGDPLDELLARHDEAIVDRELAKLPDSLRAPLVLRYLAGKSNEAVAQELGISITALEGRLKRAKQRLRVRLIRQGITLFSTVAILKTTRVALGQLPPELLTQTVATCFDPTSIAALPTTPDAISPTHLALEELKTMNALLISKPIAAVLSVSAIATLVLGTQLALSQVSTNGQTSAISLDVTVDAEDSGEATGAVSVTESTDDLFGEPTNDSSEPAPQKFVAGYGDELGGYGGMEGGYGMESADGVYGMEGPADMPMDLTPKKDAEPTWDQTAPFDLKPRTPAEQRITQTLAGPLTERLDFSDIALEEIVTYLQDIYDIGMQIDVQSLDDVGISPDEPVTININNVTFRTALRHLLKKLDLTYLMRDEFLLITTPEEANSELETRVYPVGYLELDVDQLCTVITGTVATMTWAANKGGEGEIMPLGDNIVISATQAVHEKIRNLLWQLTQSAKSVNRPQRTSENTGRAVGPDPFGK